MEQVFGFTFEEPKQKAQQEFVTVVETSLGKVSRFALFPIVIETITDASSRFHTALLSKKPSPCQTM